MPYAAQAETQAGHCRPEKFADGIDAQFGPAAISRQAITRANRDQLGTLTRHSITLSDGKAERTYAMLPIWRKSWQV
jgi:hypothetical protein